MKMSTSRYRVLKKSTVWTVLILCLQLSAMLQGAEEQRAVILILGDSITAGYGLDLTQAFPAIVQKKIDEAGLNFGVINAGLSGETTSGGLRRIDWLLKQPIDFLVIELGGNDGLRGITLELTESNLQKIIDKAKEKYPNVHIIIAGMEVPPNLGEVYTVQFRQLYASLARKNNLTHIPFLLEGVGGVLELNLPDGIHPNPQGHQIVAENLWNALAPLLMNFKK